MNKALDVKITDLKERYTSGVLNSTFRIFDGIEGST